MVLDPKGFFYKEFVMITGCRNTNLDLPTDDKRKILHLLIMSVKENFLLRN